MKNATNHTLDGPDFTLTGVRLTVRTVKSFFLRTLDFGMGSSPGCWCNEIIPTVLMNRTNRR
jgi:hypothetical protein